MRGVGYECSQCRAIAVDDKEVVPDGWLELSTRSVNPFGDDHQEATLHFCGWPCAERYAVLAQPEKVS